MSVSSKIILMEKLEKIDHKNGAHAGYYPAYIQKADGTIIPVLFTESQLDVAKTRADKFIKIANEEQKTSFWKLLFSELLQQKKRNGETKL